MSTTPLPRWEAIRFQRLREWFEKSPFYQGSPLASFGGVAYGGLHELRDETGQLCCTMRVEESRKILNGDAGVV